MKIHVTHLTRYEYDQSVEFAPHFLYLRPRLDQLLRLHHFKVTISPEAKFYWMRDDCDNVLACAHFSKPAAALEIVSDFQVENFDQRPLEFLLKAYAINHPFEYEPLHRFNLTPYLVKPSPETQAGLRAWLAQYFPNPPQNTVAFLAALNDTIYKTLKYRERKEHGIQPSLQTAALGTGSCRDYAVFLMEILRTLGLAARFVSGYDYDPSFVDQPNTSMHSWAEVYLPGAGWKSLDPSVGLFCFDNYVPLAHAAVAESVNPVQGAYAPRSAITRKLHTEIAIEKTD